MQPPNKPPPITVVSSSTSFNSHTDPWACMTSLTPPWTMMTDNAIVAPTTNHQANTFTDATKASHVWITVKRTILNGFCDMHGLDPLGVGQICDRPRNS